MPARKLAAIAALALALGGVIPLTIVGATTPAAPAAGAAAGPAPRLVLRFRPAGARPDGRDDVVLAPVPAAALAGDDAALDALVMSAVAGAGALRAELAPAR